MGDNQAMRTPLVPKVGDVVLKDEWGGGTTYVEVTSVHEDIKNGRPGFTGIILERMAQQNGNDPFILRRTDTHDNKWGYNDQVRSIVHERVVKARL